MTCTRPLTVPMTAYLDWLINPTSEKKILESSISMRWYNIIESTESTNNILGPHAKFNEKRSWVVNNSERKIGAEAVVGLGIKKISFVNILNKSASI